MEDINRAEKVHETSKRFYFKHSLNYDPSSSRTQTFSSTANNLLAFKIYCIEFHLKLERKKVKHFYKVKKFEMKKLNEKYSESFFVVERKFKLSLKL